jgi:SAM-dependent methyltransferase
VRATFGGFEGLRVIELGAGAGTNAALMARRGADVTVLDYSERALDRARELFAANVVTARWISGDALLFPHTLRGQFDVAMSFGLNEHFTGRARVLIFSAHLDALAPGGIAFISVPNAHNLPYRAFKWLAETTRRWRLGVEVPFERAELEAICSSLGVRDFEFFGDAFLTSLRFINPWTYLHKRDRVRRDLDCPRVPQERASPLDDRFGYATVLVIKKC